MRIVSAHHVIHSKAIAATSIAVMVLAGVAGLRHLGLLQELELATYDRYLQVRPNKENWHSPVVLVRIYEEDIQRYGHPLPDALLAQALKRLSALRSRAIGVDLFRDLPSKGRENLQSIVARNPHIVMIEKRLGNPIPPPEFLQAPAQVGFADLKKDSGGIIRRGLLILWDEQDERQFYLSFSLQLALKYLQKHGITLTADPTNSAHVRLGHTTLPRFRGDDGGYRGADDGGYQYHLDYGRGRIPFPSFSISQVLNGKLDPETIHGAVVILGTTSISVQDQYETPFSVGWGMEEPMYGVEIHGHAVDQLIRTALRGDTPLKTLNQFNETLWIFLWSSIGAALGIWIRSPWLLTLAAVGLALPFVTGYLVFVQGLWIPSFPPALAYIGSFGIAIAYISHREHAEHALIMQLFGQYVSREIAKTLWEQREQFMEGGRPRPQELTVTVMITDLQGYTSPAEAMTPFAVMEWINSYMNAMTQIVEAHGGIVDDYAGDGLKANFGVPIPRTSEAEIAKDAKQAVDSALEMGEAIIDLNQQWSAQGLPTERLRIGILTGPTIAGSIGSAQRMAYTTVGDTVNTAARLESFDKEGFEADASRAFRILIGESTWKHLGPGYRTECLGPHRLRGREKAVTLYRVFSRDHQEARV